MSEQLHTALDSVGITIKEDYNRLRISSKFRITNPIDRATIGVLVIALTFLVGGLLLSDHLTEQLVVLSISLPLIIFSILSISKQATDYVSVADGKIEFRSSLKKKVFEIGQVEKVEMEATTSEEKLRKIPRSYWRQVEIWVEAKEGRFRVLNFQVNERDSKMAHLVGSEIVHRLKEKTSIAHRA